MRAERREAIAEAPGTRCYIRAQRLQILTAGTATMVAEYLSVSPYCAGFRAGEPREGGARVTVAELATRYVGRPQRRRAAGALPRAFVVVSDYSE